MEYIQRDYPGLIVYENLLPTNNTFGVAIYAEIDETQYWRDRPIFLNYIDSILAPAIEYNQEDTKNFFNIPDLNIHLENNQEIEDSLAFYNEETKRVGDLMAEYSVIKDMETNPVDYLNIAPELEDIIIKDADGNVIDTISIDTTRRAIKDALSSNSGIPITLLDVFPDGFTDESVPENYDINAIVSLPDSYIKDKLWITREYLPELSKEMAGLTKEVIKAFDNFVEHTPKYEDNTEEISQILSTPGEDWYGIPLINLSPMNISVQDSFILHVDTHNNWRLTLSNITDYGVDATLAVINKTIPPQTKFMAGLYVAMNHITMYLKIEGDNKVYWQELDLPTIPHMQVTAYGTDSEGMKSLYGFIWDMFYWDKAEAFLDPKNFEPPMMPIDANNYFGKPGPGDKFTVINNNIKDAYNNGKWYDIGGYGFVADGYVDRFFCRSKFLDKSWTISWYQYQSGYPTGIKTLIADNIFNNYVRYDYDNFNLLINFNGVKYQQIITFPDFLWGQFALKYNKDTTILTFEFRDIFWDRLETIDVYIGEGLEFELMSMWARFDQEEGRYIEIQKGALGFLSIYESYKSKEDLKIVFDANKKFLTPYIPRYIAQIPIRR